MNYNKIDSDFEKRLKLVKNINADVVLVLGNNERRILENEFSGNFESFKNYLIECGFVDVIENQTYVKIKEREFCLMHCPEDADKSRENNLFGHIHKCCFVKKYGLNVGVDNHYFKLFDEDEIEELFSRRKFYDENVYN